MVIFEKKKKKKKKKKKNNTVSVSAIHSFQSDRSKDF